MDSTVDRQDMPAAVNVRKHLPVARQLLSIKGMLTVLLVMAILALLYIARSVVLPLAAAFLLSLVFRPIIRHLTNWRIPAPLVSLLLVSLLGFTLGFAIYLLKEPANQWLAEAPQSLRLIDYRIRELKQPISDMQEATEELSKLGETSPGYEREVVLKDTSLNDGLLSKTGESLFGILITLVALFFYSWLGRSPVSKRRQRFAAFS
ncbi:MAG: AI-2E family transporter [Chromatiales bacterium]